MRLKALVILICSSCTLFLNDQIKKVYYVKLSDNNMDRSTQKPPHLFSTQQLDESQQSTQQMRLELAQSLNMARKATQNLNTGNENNTALQAWLFTRRFIQIFQVKLKTFYCYNRERFISCIVIDVVNSTRSTFPEQTFLVDLSFLE